MSNKYEEIYLEQKQKQECIEKLTELFIKDPEHKKLGKDVICKIIKTALDQNVDPSLALSSGYDVIQGQVTMKPSFMAMLILKHKHHIMSDPRSNDKICIVHGQRYDTKLKSSESYTIEEAIKAGLVNKSTWKSQTSSMLYARALSRLGRRLFNDIIKGCYVEGEIALDTRTKEEKETISSVKEIEIAKDTLTDEQNNELLSLLNKVPDYRSKVESFLKKQSINSFKKIPLEMYERIINKANEEIEKQNSAQQVDCVVEENAVCEVNV